MEVHANKMLTAGSSTFAYDDKGNTLTETNGSIVTTYTWDLLNRMMQWQKTGQTTETYLYNADGMRVRKTPAGGTQTDFLLDGKEIAEEMAGSSDISYAGPGLIEKIAGTDRTIYHADGIGSTRAMSDINQAVAIAVIYDAYGRLKADYPSSTAGNLGYSAQSRYYTDSSGLQYVKARYYEAGTGRFISRDPIGYQGGLNLYAYASDDPTNDVDPSGMGNMVWPGNSRICNDSDGCVIVYNNGSFIILRPGECTSWFFDRGDFGYWDGLWRKCGGKPWACKVGNDGDSSFKPLVPGFVPPKPPPGICWAYCMCQRRGKRPCPSQDDCMKQCTSGGAPWDGSPRNGGAGW